MTYKNLSENSCRLNVWDFRLFYYKVLSQMKNF
jgi:hypothetical protein